MRSRVPIFALFALFATLTGCKRPPVPTVEPLDASVAVASATPSAVSSAPTTCRVHWHVADGHCARDPEWKIEELGVGAATYGCARYANGQVWCAGQNSMAQLGRGTRAPISVETPIESPALVTGVGDALRLVTAVLHACVIVKDGHVWCWGLGTSGEVGAGKEDVFMSPDLVVGVTDAIDIAAENSHTCVVRRGGKVACWGNNDEGQLGDGTTKNRSSPVEVKGVTNAKQVAVGFHHSCALTTAGTVMCWGAFGAGKTNLATTIDGLAKVDSIASNQIDFCARTGAKVMCGGHDKIGEAKGLNGATQLAGGNFVMFSRNKDGAVTFLEDTRALDAKAAVKFPSSLLLSVGGSWECVVRSDEQVECNPELPARGAIQFL